MAVSCVCEPSRGLAGGGGGSSRAQQEDQVAQLYAGTAFGDEQRPVRRPPSIGQSRPLHLMLHYPAAEGEQTTTTTAAAAPEATRTPLQSGPGTVDEHNKYHTAGHDQVGHSQHPVALINACLVDSSQRSDATQALSPVPPKSSVPLDRSSATNYATPDAANCDILNCSSFRTSPTARSAPNYGAHTNDANITSASASVEPAKPGAHRKERPASRRYQSLESVHSSHSSSYSSANELTVIASCPSTITCRSHQLRQQVRRHRQAPASRLASPNSVLVGTRYVSPPRVADDHHQRERLDHSHADLERRSPAAAADDNDDWQTIELDDRSQTGNNLGTKVPAHLDPRRSFWSIDAAHVISPSNGNRVPFANNFRFARFASLVPSCNFKSLAKRGSDRTASPLAGGQLKSASVNLGAKHTASMQIGHLHRDTSGAGTQNRASARDSLTGKQVDSDAGQQVSSAASSRRKSSSHNRRESSDGKNGPRKSVASVASSTQRPKQQIGIREAPFMFAGILASILGSLFFSVATLCIKLLPDGHGLAEKTKLVFFRGVILMLLCAGSILHQRSTFLIKRDEIVVNALRSVFGFAGVYGSYVSLKYISMGDSTALVFSSPVWTSLLSHFILNEPLKWIQLIALPASFVGIVLIAHPALLVNMEHEAGATERQPVLDLAEVLPPEQVASGGGANLANDTGAALLAPVSGTNQTLASVLQTINTDLDISTNASEHFDFEHRWKGIVIALATSLIVSLVYIVLKFRKTTPIQTTTFWLGAATAALSFAIMCCIGFGEWPQGAGEWALILCNGLCSWLGQVLLQWALFYDDASVLSVVRTLDVAMTFTLSALFLDEQILWTSILGGAIIAAVVVSMMLNSWLTKKLCPSSRDSLPRPSQVGDVDELGLDEQDAPAALKSNANMSLIAGLDGARALKYLEANGGGGGHDKHQVAVLSGAGRKSSASTKPKTDAGAGAVLGAASLVQAVVGAEPVQSRQVTAAA